MRATNVSVTKHMSNSIVDFLAAVDSIAQLWAADGQFLGVLSSNQYDLNSVANPSGFYGGSCGVYSIQNPSGMYGGACGFYSPYNISCMNPPVVLYQNQAVLVVTRSLYAQTSGLPVVDPDLLLSIYTPQQTTYQHPVLVHQQNMADLASTMIQSAAYRSASNAELIRASMGAGAQIGCWRL